MTKFNRIAIVSDIHGNLTAFQAVLDDIAERRIETVYCLGDMVGKGPASAEIVDICRDLCPVVIRGNWEDGLAHNRYVLNPIHQWHKDRLGADRLRWMGQLPMAYEFVLSGKRVRLMHATPQELHAKINNQGSYRKWMKMFSNTEMLGLSTPSPDIVIFGHTHRSLVYNLSEDGKLLINSGSVGNSTDRLRMATYLILEGKLDLAEPAMFSYQIVRLPYNIDSALAEARAAELPDFSFYEYEQRNGDYRANMEAYQALRADMRG